MNPKLLGTFILATNLACICGLFPIGQAPIEDEILIINTETPTLEPLSSGPTEPPPPTEAPAQDHTLLDTQDNLSDGHDIELQFGYIPLEPWADITKFQAVEQNDGTLQFITSFNVEGEWQNLLAQAYEVFQFPPNSRVDFYGIGFYNADEETFSDGFFDIDNIGQHRINWTFDPVTNSFQGQYFFLEDNQWVEGDSNFTSIEAVGDSLVVTTTRQDWMEGVYVYATMAVCAQACILDIVGYQPEVDEYELLLPSTSSSTSATVTMENNLDVPVCFVRIYSSVGGSFDEILATSENPIAPGDILSTRVEIGEIIDIQIRDCNDEVIDEQFSIEMTSDGIYYSFSPSTGLGED